MKKENKTKATISIDKVLGSEANKLKREIDKISKVCELTHKTIIETHKTIEDRMSKKGGEINGK
jgi:deoxyribose-phosphate aldolase